MLKVSNQEKTKSDDLKHQYLYVNLLGIELILWSRKFYFLFICQQLWKAFEMIWLNNFIDAIYKHFPSSKLASIAVLPSSTPENKQNIPSIHIRSRNRKDNRIGESRRRRQQQRERERKVRNKWIARQTTRETMQFAIVASFSFPSRNSRYLTRKISKYAVDWIQNGIPLPPHNLRSPHKSQPEGEDGNRWLNSFKDPNIIIMWRAITSTLKHVHNGSCSFVARAHSIRTKLKLIPIIV